MLSIYLSCPVVGRRLEDINNSRECMRKYAELMLGKECVVINGFPLCDNGYKNISADGQITCTDTLALHTLSDNIKCLAYADVFVGITTDTSIICSCERDIAHRFNKRVLLIDIEDCCCFNDMNKRRFIDY